MKVTQGAAALGRGHRRQLDAITLDPRPSLWRLTHAQLALTKSAMEGPYVSTLCMTQLLCKLIELYSLTL